MGQAPIPQELTTKTARTRPNATPARVASPSRPKSIGASVRTRNPLSTRIQNERATAKSLAMSTSQPSLAVDCPRCGLAPQVHRHAATAAYKLWPSAPWPRRPSSLAAVDPPAWSLAVRPRAAGRARQRGDYEARAPQLGIHLFPSSNCPSSSASAPSSCARGIPSPARCASVC